ncbi:MAG: alanine racemase [Verrucomicrobiota bacterium]|jgi:alanine racemase
MTPAPTPTPRCWAEIDLDALRHNLTSIRQHIGPNVRILTVVKADAYGHGLKAIAGHLMRCGTDVFGVANLTEAQTIRSVGRGWPTLLLSACLPDEVHPAVRDGIMLTVSSQEELKWISQQARKLNTTAQIHLKVDTGMGRLGAAPEELPDLVHKLHQLPNLKWAGIFTHFSSAEEDTPFTQKQLRSFENVIQHLSTSTTQLPAIHACNSAALLHESAARFNLVRPGLLVYGITPQGKRPIPSTLTLSLQPVLSFKTRVTRVRLAPPNTPVSYGQQFVTSRPTRLATLAIGYADGLPRSASPNAHILLHGKQCPILGRITMDQTVVDVTNLPQTQPGDTAVVIGSQEEESISATTLATWCNTIPWEILTNISYRVPRIYRGARAS